MPGIFQESTIDVESENGDTKEQEEINAVVQQVLKGKGRALQMVKLMVLMSIPLVALITISTITLVEIFTQFLNAKRIATTAEWFLNVDSLIASLQVERGLSATYITAGYNAADTMQALWHQYNTTNLHVWKLQYWPADFTYQNAPINSKQLFIELLKDVRGKVSSIRLSFDESTRIYTEINTELMDIATYSVHIAGNMWPYLVSASAMLRASDAIGIQRALGSSFFLMCELGTDIYEWFMQLDGEIRSLQDMSFIYRPDVEVMWNDSLNRTLLERLLVLKSQIYSSSFRLVCLNMSEEARVNRSNLWFDSMSNYVSQWKGIRLQLLGDITALISDDMVTKKKEVTIYTICIGITLVTFLLALVFSANYASNMKQLTSKIAEFAEQVMTDGVA